MTGRAVSAGSCCGSSTISASIGCARIFRGGGFRPRSSACRRRSRRCSGSSIGRSARSTSSAPRCAPARSSLAPRRLRRRSPPCGRRCRAISAPAAKRVGPAWWRCRGRPTAGGEVDLPDERPTPEDAVIAGQDEETLEQATGALKAAIARLPQEIRLYLQYVMSGDRELAPRDIARLMARPVTEIYRLRQQAERMLRQALSENSAVKNLRMSV